MASLMGCSAGTLPFVHLGISIGANMKLVKHWSPIIKKFKEKMSSWKAKNLSFGGRLTLVKSVLGHLPLYYFSMFKAPKKTVSELEKIRRKFLWGGNCQHKKIHWVGWNMVAKSKCDGGLGVGCLRSMNLALLCKWWWCALTEAPGLAYGPNPSKPSIMSHSRLQLTWEKKTVGGRASICRTDSDLIKIGKPIHAKLRKNIGFNSSTPFWKVNWFGLSLIKAGSRWLVSRDITLRAGETPKNKTR